MKNNFKLVVFMGLSGLCFAAQAADIVKTNNNDALNLGSSWVGGTAPGANDRAIYNQTTTLTNDLGADLSWSGIVLTNNTRSWIISGSNTLTLGAGGIDMAAAGNNFTINSAIALGATQVWNIATSRTLTIGGVLSGGASYTLIKNGTGTLTITNSGNTYSGGTVVNGGTLSCSQDNPLGSGSLTLNDGVFFSLPGGGTITNAVVIPVGQNATINGNGTLNGPLSGSGSLTHGGNGAFVLALLADNSGFSGSITNAAVISIKNKNSLGTGTLYMNNGTNSALAAQADLLGFNAITNNIILLSTAKLGATSNAKSFELKGVVSGPGGLTANHPSVTVTLSGVNTYTGITAISNGALIVNGSLASPLITAASTAMLSGTGTVQAAVMNSGAALEIGGSVPGTMNFNGNLTLASGSTNVMKVFSTNSHDVLRGAGTNTLSASGTVVLDFSGYVTIEEGDQFNVTQLYQNWSNVVPGVGLNVAAAGLPGSFAMDASTVSSNGLVTIVPANVSPLVLPEQFPIAMTYHGPTPATNTTITEELVKYQNIEIMGAVADGVWNSVRTTFPSRIVLKQSAWGSDIETPNKLDIFPGHLLLKTGTKLAANVSATSTVFYVDDYTKIAANQGVIDRDNADGKPLYVLIYKLDGSGKPDWSQTERAIVTAINADKSFVLSRAQFGGTPLAFEAGKTVMAKHMMFWGGQWQLNFSLQCPRGGPLNLTAAEWFAREVKRTVEESGADGVEFDVARWGCAPQWGAMDCNNDLITDYGYIDGVQSFGLGGQVFLKELRKLLGPGKIIQHDGNGTGMQRGRKYVNGVQMESFPNANDYSTFTEAFLHFRHWTEDVETLPKFSYGYVKTVTTTFANMVDTDGSNLDWHFRVGFASGLLAGMPSPFSSITDADFIPDEDINTNVTAEGSGGAIFKWDEYVGGDLNDWQWLGKPLGEAVQVLGNLDSSNLLASAVWRWKVETNFSAACLTNSGEFSTVMTSLAPPTNVVPGSLDHFSGTQIPKIPAFGVRLEIASGTPVFVTNQEYTIEFEACGNDSWNYAGQSFEKVPRALSILTPQDDTTLDVLISSNWVPYRMSFFVTTNSPLTFGFSEQIGNAAVRNIRLYKGGAERWMREFEHGRVYLNMTKTPWAVNVGTGVVQRLIGTQSTNINTGAAENGTLTVPSWDAVFLRTWTVDAWKSAYFTPDQLTNSTVSGDSADPDADGSSNYQEYVAGTHPTNALSRFDVSGTFNQSQVLDWSSVSGRVYDVYWTTNLMSSFVPLQTNIAWPQSAYTSPMPDGVKSRFYQLKVRRP
jgi:autotransporter-associated beta strand protein